MLYRNCWKDLWWRRYNKDAIQDFDTAARVLTLLTFAGLKSNALEVVFEAYDYGKRTDLLTSIHIIVNLQSKRIEGRS